MEAALRPDLVCSAEPGRVSIIDVQRFLVDPAPNARDLDPDDRALIEGIKHNRPRASAAQPVWLMKTKYLQAKDNGGAVRALEKQAPVPELTREVALREIEDGFQAARVAPVHPKKPHLVPVDVMSVLPDMSLWENTYHTTTCASEPLTGLDLPQRSAAQRNYLLENSLMKAYRMPPSETGAENAVKDFLALLVPQDAPSDEELAAAGGALPAGGFVEGRFQWVREFTFANKADVEGSRAFGVLLNGKTATYVPIVNNYHLGKRKRQDFADVPVPKRVTVSTRPIDAAEAEARKKRMHALYGFEDDT